LPTIFNGKKRDLEKRELAKALLTEWRHSRPNYRAVNSDGLPLPVPS
jgi:hypothetical protein